jgi:endonuclease/exonuclease/phosphatase family metal-dependent hydrolase
MLGGAALPAALGLAAVAAAATVLIIMLGRVAQGVLAVAGGALALAAEADHASTRLPKSKGGAQSKREAFYSENAAGREGPAPLPASLPSRPHLLAYNVHTFVDLQGRATLNEVGALLRAYSPAVEVVVLAEVLCSRAALAALLEGAGLPHFLAVANGMADDSLTLVVASRHPCGATRVDTTPPPEAGTSFPRVHRQQVLFTTSGGLRGAAVHLEIGARLSHRAEDAATDAELRARNSAVRCAQLEKVLAHRPDFLAGDFNFKLDDPERWFLASRGYVPTNDGATNSTPYNRVDHVFVREALAAQFPFGSNALVRCNYSDHLPMLQALP